MIDFRLTNSDQPIIICPFLYSCAFLPVAPMRPVLRLLKFGPTILRILWCQKYEHVTVVSCLRWRSGWDVAHELCRTVLVVLANGFFIIILSAVDYVSRVFGSGIVFWLELQATDDPMTHLRLDRLGTARVIRISQD